MLRLRSAWTGLLAIACIGAMVPTARMLADEQNGVSEKPAATADSLSPEDRIRQALEGDVQIEANEASLDEVVEWLRGQTKLNVLLDRRALEDVGLSGDLPVTATLEDVTLRSALNLLLDPLELTWTIDEGALVITTPEEAETRLLTKVYNVADFVSVKTDGEVHYDHGPLISLIESIVHPETWDTVGGPASVEPYRETLIVSHTELAHQELESLLDALREGRRIAGDEPDAPPSEVSIPVSDRAERRIRTALERPISLDLNETRLSELPALLKNEIGVPTVLDHAALEDIGISADTPVSLSVQNMPARQALRHLLRPLDLATIVSNQVLLLTTREEAEVNLEVRVYPVRDLHSPQCDDGDELEGGSQAGPEELITAITGTIHPDAWDFVGGPGAIESLPQAGVLAVAQTEEAHEEIERLLKRLRKTLTEKPAAPVAEQRADDGALKLVVYSLPMLARTSQAERQAAPGPNEQNAPNGAAPGGLGGGGAFAGPASGPISIPGDDLVEVVTALVDPESWEREGVYIKAMPGRLVVRHNEIAHRKIQTLLVRLGLKSPHRFLPPTGFGPGGFPDGFGGGMSGGGFGGGGGFF